MKVKNSTEALSAPLILSQRNSSPTADAAVLFQQACLSLAGDRQSLVLRRYYERYSPESGEWVEYVHTVSTSALMHWIISNGQLHIEGSAVSPDDQEAQR